MSTFSWVLHCSATLSEHLLFSSAGFTKSVSDVLVARQPLRGGVEHKFKGASQLPDQLMTNVKVPVMSTIDFAFLLSPDLTLQKREQRHTCTKPSLSPPLSVFSLSFPASVLSFQKVDFCTHLLMTTYTHIHFLSDGWCAHPAVCLIPCPPSHSFAPITGAWNQPHLLMPREKLIDKCFIFHLFHCVFPSVWIVFLLSQATELSWSL